MSDRDHGHEALPMPPSRSRFLSLIPPAIEHIKPSACFFEQSPSKIPSNQHTSPAPRPIHRRHRGHLSRSLLWLERRLARALRPAVHPGVGGAAGAAGQCQAVGADHGGVDGGQLRRAARVPPAITYFVVDVEE
jgi:hypothetical protein